MCNGFAMALASQDHLRYFKAQKASEGKRFHELDFQSHIEKQQKPTDPTKMLDFPYFSVSTKPHSQYHTERQQKPWNITKIIDFHTSQYAQSLVFSITLRSSKKQISNAYTSGTQAKRCFSVDRKHCIRRISMPTILTAKIFLFVTLNALRLTNA